jgi:hypothetical protein
MTDKWDMLKIFVDDEISFHNEHETPKIIKLLCHLFGQRTPQEVVLRELWTIKKEMEYIEVGK